MASLIERSACEGLLPRFVGETNLSELPFARLTSLAPLKGKARPLAAALKEMGLGWPKPGQSLAGAGGAVLWTGRDQAFLIGADPAPLRGLAATTDQSDGWARTRLKGPRAEAVLARLVPLDLRRAVFPDGAVARSALGHMMTILTRSGGDSFDIMVFRSMAASAVHEIVVAAEAVAARAQGH